MKLTYDPSANVAYIRLRERQGDVDTIELTSDFLVDADETGIACGIELLNANDQLARGDDGKLIFVNALCGGPVGDPGGRVMYLLHHRVPRRVQGEQGIALSSEGSVDIDEVGSNPE